MAEVYVGAADFDDDTRAIVDVDGSEVVVLRANGRFYAFENTCLHMGGPVGEGLVMGRVQAVLDGDRKVVREEFSQTDLQLVCPWHGWAYDLETGRCAGDPSLRLRSYTTEVREDGVYVIG